MNLAMMAPVGAMLAVLAAASQSEPACTNPVEDDSDGTMLLQNQVRKATPMACSFEESGIPYCGIFSQVSGADHFDWARRSGSTPSSNTGPTSAFDGIYYLYAETSSPRQPGHKAILEATVPLDSGSLDFEYQMYGATMGSLNVGVSVAGTRTQLWMQSGDKGNAWKHATVDLANYSGQTVTIYFEAVRGSSWSGDIAIDKVMLPISASFTTSTTTTTTSTTTTSTTTTVTTKAPSANYCGFETGGVPYCGLWHQEQSDAFDWTRETGGTPSSSTGPAQAFQSGYYVYIETSSPRQSGDEAILSAYGISVPGAGATLDFWCHMYGSSMGSLKVAADGNTLWQKSGDQGDGWQYVSVALPPGDITTLNFVGTRGSSYRGDVAIDGVDLMGVSFWSTTTTTSTTTTSTTTTSTTTTTTTTSEDPRLVRLRNITSTFHSNAQTLTNQVASWEGGFHLYLDQLNTTLANIYEQLRGGSGISGGPSGPGSS